MVCWMPFQIGTMTLSFSQVNAGPSVFFTKPLIVSNTGLITVSHAHLMAFWIAVQTGWITLVHSQENTGPRTFFTTATTTWKIALTTSHQAPMYAWMNPKTGW